MGYPYGSSNFMALPPSKPTPPSDIWAEWLLHRRHGGDPKQQPVIRDFAWRIGERVLDGAQLAFGQTLVDVGTGDGLVAFGAIQRVGPSLKLIFTDLSAALLECARERAGELGVLEQCTFLQTRAEQLEGVADGSADALTTRAVLAYVPDKAAAARQMYRVLKPGGRVSIGEPIHQDEAVKLAGLTHALRTRPPDAVTAPVRLLQRCRALQLPSTIAEIQANPLTNFTERDLFALFLKAGFKDIHLELHLDLRQGAPVLWETFIDTAPSPGVPTLREAFGSQLSEIERKQIEEWLRPQVESGSYTERSAVAYLTAVKGHSQMAQLDAQGGDYF